MSQQKLVRKSLVIGAVVSALMAPLASAAPMADLGRDIGQAMQSSLDEARQHVANDLQQSIALQVRQALGLDQAVESRVQQQVSMVREPNAAEDNK